MWAFEPISSFLLVVTPIVVYDNADLQKESIFKENKGKSGIYLWTNLKNGKKYVGSSLDIRRRMYNYYDAKYLVRYKSMIICRALLKHGYSNFSLVILEYCEPANLIGREQHFINLIKPEYNILKKAGSSFGFKHSEETLAKFRARRHSEESKIKISEAQRKNDNPARFKEGHKHSEETTIKISDAMKGRKKSVGAGKPSVQIEVLDLETGTKTTYYSMSEAARALDITQSTITRYFSRNNPKPCKGRYIFTK
jgi:group I intron endonuclease